MSRHECRDYVLGTGKISCDQCCGRRNLVAVCVKCWLALHDYCDELEKSNASFRAELDTAADAIDAAGAEACETKK